MLKYPKPQQNGNNKKPAFNIYWMYAIILLSLFALFYFQDASQTKEVDWTAFEKAALAGDLKKVMVLSGLVLPKDLSRMRVLRNISLTPPMISMATRK